MWVHLYTPPPTCLRSGSPHWWHHPGHTWCLPSVKRVAHPSPFLLPSQLSTARARGRHWGTSRRLRVRFPPILKVILECPFCKHPRFSLEPAPRPQVPGGWSFPAQDPPSPPQEEGSPEQSPWAWRQEGVYTRVQACLRVSPRSKSSPEVTRPSGGGAGQLAGEERQAAVEWGGCSWVPPTA